MTKPATNIERITDEIREYYKTLSPHAVDQLRARVVELLNLIEEKGWNLTYRLRDSYCCFYFRRRRVFGVTLFSLPTFGIWITEREAEQWESHCKPQRYDHSYTCAVYPRDTTVDQLRLILEFAYRKYQSNS